MNRIFIIRHGQTEKNKAHALQGRSDDLLNDAGKMQAREAADWFKDQGITFDMVYSSPLKRAMDTGRIAAGEHIPLQIDDRLIEMDYGLYEGMDLTKPAPEVITFFSDFVNNPAPEGMEPLADVVARAGNFLENIKGQIEGKTVLISTHAIAMKGILEYLTPQSKGSYWSKFIGNCAVYETKFEDGRFMVPWEAK